MIKSLWLSFRPKTLTAAIVPIIVGTALVKTTAGSLILPQAEVELESINWLIVSFALLSALCIQIATNLVNDVADFKKGADTEERLGPKRVTQSGLISPQKVTLLAVVFFVLAVGFGIPLVFEGGLPIVYIGIASIFCGFAYTAGPFPLAYKGFGDLFVLLFFGLVAVCGMFYLQTKSVSFGAIVAGLQVGFLATVLIAINNLRDSATDSKVGKKTMAVRFGEKFSKVEISLLLLFPFVLNFFWYKNDFLIASLLPLVLLPKSINLLIGIWRNNPGTIYNQYLAESAKIHLFFGILFGVGLWL